MAGGPARNTPKTEDRENNSSVLYIGRIPHGFYENEMEGVFWLFQFCVDLFLVLIYCVLSLCIERLLQVFLNSLVQLRGSEFQGAGRFVSYFSCSP